MKSSFFRLGAIISILLMLSIPSNAQIKFGLGAGIISDGSTPLIQGRVEIGPRSFHLANSFSFILEDIADWAIDIDGHYLIGVVNDNVFLDLFPGLNIFKTNSDTDIGINLGGTVRIETDTNAIYIEPKYTIATYDSFVLTAGLIF